MAYDEVLKKFGFPATPGYRDEIRQLLANEIEKERQGKSGEEMLRVLCLQLFSMGFVEDSLLIWEAKQSSFDAGCGLDIQFLCGAGLDATKEYLENSSAESAPKALSYLARCEQTGDFTNWTPQTTVVGYRRYYKLS